MSLNQELSLVEPIKLLPHEVLLNIYHTASCIKKKADDYLRGYGLTDVQFNLMMLLRHQGGGEQALNQAQISQMMLVNRANITSLVDRMERADLVVRTADESDRRYNLVRLTRRGELLLSRVEPGYAEEIKKRMANFTETEQRQLINNLEKIRGSMSAENVFEKKND